MYQTILRRVAALAKRYEAEILVQWGPRKDRYLKHWFDAFDFFLAHVYYQGRRDALSTRYYQRAMDVLTLHFGEDDDTQTTKLFEAWDAQWIPHDADWRVYSGDNPISKALAATGAGKYRDQQMVLDALRYAYGLPNHNVVAYSLLEVRSRRILAHQAELQSIWQIGPKTSSFYLRDLCSLYGVEPEADGAEAVQPIDTWVWQICEAIGIASVGDDLPAVRSKLLAACDRDGVSAPAFNMGAWYLGTHSLEIALDLLRAGAVEGAG